jgi:hypothetical protein
MLGQFLEAHGTPGGVRGGFAGRLRFRFLNCHRRSLAQ